MKTYYECLPCFSRQALTTLKHIDPTLHDTVMRDVMHMLGDVDYFLSPPQLAGEIYKIIGKYSDLGDYYADDKKASNKHVLEIFDKLKEKIVNSPNPFATAVKFSIAGNIIDFNAKHDFTIEKIQEELAHAMAMDIDEVNIHQLQKAVENAKQIPENFSSRILGANPASLKELCRASFEL